VWLVFDPVTGQTTDVALSERAPAASCDIVVSRIHAESIDGTQVPLTLLSSTTLDGDTSPRPLILTGYGGYDISVTPRFDPAMLLLVEQGAIHAVANLRGGQEFGAEWHEQGARAHKQNVFDDFAACITTLIARGYTSPRLLGLIGRSNGGLLLGAMITQHPNRFNAAVAAVGVYDVLRQERSTNGQFNVTEAGTIDDEQEFLALHRYSPYHRVIDGTSYPAVLFITGDNDTRVDPMHSRKMVARLQAASRSTAPIVLRTSATTGHSATAAGDVLAENVDTCSFLMHALAVASGDHRPADVA
jgi:prolyl oligopeptidase